jgi:hypothetical protein
MRVFLFESSFYTEQKKNRRFIYQFGENSRTNYTTLYSSKSPCLSFKVGGHLSRDVCTSRPSTPPPRNAYEEEEKTHPIYAHTSLEWAREREREMSCKNMEDDDDLLSKIQNISHIGR